MARYGAKPTYDDLKATYGEAVSARVAEIDKWLASKLSLEISTIQDAEKDGKQYLVLGAQTSKRVDTSVLVQKCESLGAHVDTTPLNGGNVLFAVHLPLESTLARATVASPAFPKWMAVLLFVCLTIMIALLARLLQYKDIHFPLF